VFELVQAFCDHRHVQTDGSPEAAAPATRLRLRTDVLAGTWEALVTGQVDLAIGVTGQHPNPGGVEMRPLGAVPFVYCVAPHHALASATEPLTDDQLVHHRAVAVADSAQRLTPITVNLLPGQDVLTVHNMRSKLEALLRCLGSGFLPEPLARPHLDAGRLIQKMTSRPAAVVELHYAWRADRGDRGVHTLGRALQWWLAQLESPATRAALLQRHGGPLG
jgi:DNA-binding transcriptional LysR family regulator